MNNFLIEYEKIEQTQKVSKMHLKIELKCTQYTYKQNSTLKF